MKKILTILLVACAMLMTACQSCKHNPDPMPVLNGYNYDEVVQSDFQYIAGQYPEFHFYEVDVMMDGRFNEPGDRIITYIKTIFQVKDTCIMIEHKEGAYTEAPNTIKYHDQYLECVDMSAFNAVDWDSAMVILEPYRPELATKYVTFRRVLAPPFPQNGQYIFGPGLLVIDGATGEVIHWNEQNDAIQLTDPVENTDTIVK